MAKYRGLFFGEGATDRKFVRALTTHDKFAHHTKHWTFQYDNASGGSPRDVLTRCRNQAEGKGYSGVFCVVDLDVLKSNHPQDWQVEQSKLETEFSTIAIIWQENNLEDEIGNILGDKVVNGKGKTAINKLAIENISTFINSEYYQRLLGAVQRCENTLNEEHPE